jgi:murein DD-endopeptidase MepM/ murein hydrolase activator NlpD
MIIKNWRPLLFRKRLHAIGLGALLFCLILTNGCVRPSNEDESYLNTGAGANGTSIGSQGAAVTPSKTPFMPPTRVPGTPILTPTPDAPRPIPTLRSEPEQYTLQAGDTLGKIAQRYGIGLNDLINANQISNPNLVEVGLPLNIPAPAALEPGPDFKIIPDSELVYGPASAYFDLPAFVSQAGGYLSHYQETVEDASLSGAEVVSRVAREYSVNPRLLLAVLEYQSGWVSQAQPDPLTIDYPIRVNDPYYKGLYRQLSWTANNLNEGFYLWRVNAVSSWPLADGSVVPVSATINPGTAGVQHLFSRLLGREDWTKAVTSEGLFAVYLKLFGYPFDIAIEPLLPDHLAQPTFQLPFEPGAVWSYTGGPHPGWADGSAWAALDFAPPSEELGCNPSEAWVVGIADGLIVRAENGAVIQDLDGDGIEQTGWSILYMHVASEGRVTPGTYVHAGEHIGHPSCEGGVSNGTHLHLARRYNGEWIPADGSLPFNLDGWISEGTGNQYDGYLRRDGQVVEAWDSRKTENQIQR